MFNTKLAAACGAGVLLLGATACGGGDDPTVTNAGGQPQTSTDGGPSSTQNGGGFPGADGEVAAVDGSTAQVQSRADGQVAVTWNSSTTFTKQVSASIDDIKAGTCVMVQPAEDASSGSTDTTTVTAGTVRITEKVDGSCGGGLRGGPGGGERPDFNGQAPEGGQPPEGFEPPTDGGGGAPQVRGLGGALGEVTAVSADGFTVKATVPQFGGNGSTPTTEETSITVTVTGSTTYTTTGEGSAADVKVGECLRAEGDADSTGAITARTIAMSPATEGECGGTFFRRGGPGNGSGNGSGDSTGRES